MTIEQTVEIPVSHRLIIEVPPEIPVGKSRVIVQFPETVPRRMTAAEAIERGLGLGSGSRMDPAEAIKRCSGITKRLGFTLSSDDFLAMRRENKAIEYRLDALHEEERQEAGY